MTGVHDARPRGLENGPGGRYRTMIESVSSELQAPPQVQHNPGPQQTDTWPLIWADLDPADPPNWVTWRRTHCWRVMGCLARAAGRACTLACATATSTGARTLPCTGGPASARCTLQASASRRSSSIESHVSAPGGRSRSRPSTRQAAIEALLRVLAKTADQARIDPSRTMVELGDQLWTIVGVIAQPPAGESGSQRRAGAKHKRVALTVRN